MNGCWKCAQKSGSTGFDDSRLLCDRCSLGNSNLESNNLAAYVRGTIAPTDTVPPDVECLSFLASLATQATPSANPSISAAMDPLLPSFGFPSPFDEFLGPSSSEPICWPLGDHRGSTFGCGLDQHTIVSSENVPVFSDVLATTPSDLLDYPTGLRVGENDLILAPTTVQVHPFVTFDPLRVNGQIPNGFHDVSERSSLDLASQTQYGPSASSLSSTGMTPGQTSLFQALFSLENSPQRAATLTNPLSRPSTSSSDSSFPSADRESVIDEDEDPEEIETLVCGTPVLDRNVESNSLPFVLYSYAVWMRRMMFDPLRTVSKTRDYIIRHYSESDKSRSRTILVGNLLRAIATKPSFDLDYLPMVTALRTTMRQALTNSANRKQNPSREVEIRESTRALYHTLELITISKFDPLPTTLQLMREAAPVFRRACPEPLDQPVHLPSMLIHPEANMRHYPVMDVYFSVMTGLPMNLRYDTTLGSTFDASLLDISGHLGLSWLHGQPDRLTLVLARINMLYHDFGANVEPSIIREIEQDIQEFKAIPGTSPDPSMTVTRLVVQECWRQAAYIYLYMALGGANAQDSCVQRAQRRFMRLLHKIRPALKPDMHLASCMIFVGVATQLPEERDILMSRLRVLPEGARPDSCLSSGIQTLLDIWSRTESERRPAEWSDLRLANARILM